MHYSLFDISHFMARSQCGIWPQWLIWMHVIGDSLISFSYKAIPFIMAKGWWLHRRGELNMHRLDRYRKILLILFIAFITLCGFTHDAQVVVFWWPAYVLFGYVTVTAGVVSVTTFFVMAWAVAFSRELKV